MPSNQPFGPSFGPSFGTRHVSRKALSKTTYVPEALPRIPPKAFFETPSELATCSECRAKHRTSRILPELPRVLEYPAPGGFPPDVARVCHLSPSAERKPFLREPSEPPRVPRLPNTSRKPECAVYPSAE